MDWPVLRKYHELIKLHYRRCSTYRPTSEAGSLPAYFYSMLDDVDRLLKYSEAIRACLQSLPVGNRVVLDIGVGTGMLSALSLLHGADRVVGVDVNKTALDSATEVMNVLGYSSRFVGVTVRSNMSTDALRQTIQSKMGSVEDQPFDVVVSEILGTLWYGESMRTYMLKYAPLVKLHDGLMHSVPRTCTQYFSAYNFDSLPRGLNEAMVYALDACESTNEYLPTNNGGLGIALHLYNHTRVLAPVVVCSVDFTDPKAPFTGKISEELSVPSPGRQCFGVFEWECVLWGGIVLKNTIAECRAIAQAHGARYALARESAWGFMICSLREPSRARLVFTQTNCIELEIAASTYACSLNDVGINKFCWVCSSADTDLATGIDAQISHEADGSAVVIHVVDDVTCGAVVYCLLDRFSAAAIHLSSMYEPGTLAVAKRLFEAHPRITILGAKRQRSLLQPATFAIFPSLYHMHKDYAVRVARSQQLLRDISCTRSYPTDARNAQQDITRQASAGPAGTVQNVANLAGSIPQMIKHTNVHFSTRDFEAVPFWSIEGMVGFHVDLNVNQIIGSGPVASLQNIETLLQAANVPSAHARMLSGSGIIVRIGHLSDPFAQIDEMSSDGGSETSDSDDDYGKRRRSKKKKKRGKKAKRRRT